MALIKIPINKAGISAPSKQTQTTPKILMGSKPEDGHHTYGDRVPLIDKISLTLPVVKDADFPSLAGNAHSAVINESELFVNVKKTNKYEIQARIVIPGLKPKRYPLLQMLPKKSGTPFARLEFNPAKLGPKGFHAFDQTLSLLFADGFDYLFKHATVSRIDIAVDIQTISMNDCLFLQTQAKTTERYLADGNLETLYFGKRKGSHTKIYDKQKEQVFKKRIFNKKVIRVERVLRGQKIAFKNLFNIKNPFAALTITKGFPAPPNGLSAGKEKAWQAFRDSVQVRGAQPALKLVPEERRAKYAAHLKLNTQPWWSPSEIWSRWPNALTNIFSEIPSAAEWLKLPLVK